MESTLVIKVKYGDTLRRFSARLNKNNQLDLDMVGLRAKICSLFNFAADANLKLRYNDEDGDLVTLVDDDDLYDMMRQRLPLLRIDVHMSNDSGGKSNASSIGNATPLRSPHVIDPFRSGNVAVADVLKSVQEPLNDALSNLCLVSKVVSSASPVLANLADTISEVGKPILNSHFQPHVAAGPSTKKGTPVEHAIPEAKRQQSTYMNPTFSDFISIMTKDPFNSLYQPHVTSGPSANNGALGEHVTPEARGPQPRYVDSTSGSPFHAFADFVPKMGKPVGNSHYEWPHDVAGVPGDHVTPEERGPQPTYVDKTSNVSQPVETGNVIRGAMERVAPVDLNIPPFDLYSSQSANVNITSLLSAVPDVDTKKGKAPTNDSFAQKGKISGTHKGKVSGISSSSAAPNNGSDWTKYSAYTTPIYILRNSGSTAPDNSSTWTSSGDSGAPSLRTYHVHPFKRSHSHVMAPSGMFHKGIQCDGCGVYPIIGSRFKSKVKENYDLCSICFNTMGNMDDYNRIDRLHPRCFPTLPRTLKLARPKLDSRFIVDVNVIDGTMMAPSIAFTKIWRICNNGTLVWPTGTQLVWIGGDNFSDSHSVDLEVPEEGVPVEKELDIAVDFIAPQLPGRYISYWRMSSPSGQKFGQRVWVLIQVDASLKESFYDSSRGLNMNIPLDVGGSKGPQLTDINVQPTEEHIPNFPTEPVNEIVDNQLMTRELLLKIGKTRAAAAAASARAISAASARATSAASAPSIASSSVSYPIIELSETTPAVPSKQQSAAVDEIVDNQLMTRELLLKIGKTRAAAAAAAAAASARAISAASARATSAASAPSIASSSVSYPIIELSETAPAVPSKQQSAAVDEPSSSLGVGGNNSVEETLLKELEDMGFKQVGLNKEILRMNEYNLEQSVDDLCGVSDWDPILEELHQMGFRNNDVNKKLLMKNNGSIKRVVMDLLNGEQA